MNSYRVGAIGFYSGFGGCRRIFYKWKLSYITSNSSTLRLLRIISSFLRSLQCMLTQSLLLESIFGNIFGGLLTLFRDLSLWGVILVPLFMHKKREGAFWIAVEAVVFSTIGVFTQNAWSIVYRAKVYVVRQVFL